MHWFKGLFGKRIPKEAPPPKFVDAYRKSEEVVKALEAVGHLLEVNQDWSRLEPEMKKITAKNLAEYLKRAKFQSETLRDELILTLQRLPNTRLVRK